MTKFLDFDIEAHNVGQQYGMTPQEYFRLGQYSIDEGPVVLTEDYDEMIEVIRSAEYVCGHNINSYDLSVLFGVDSVEPLNMALDNRIIDTFTVASLVLDIPAFYKTRDGKSASTFQQGLQKPELVMKYLSLDNLAFQLDLPGKFGDLRELAKKYNPPKTPVAELQYGLIPLDDPDFREYARQDVIAGQALRKKLVTMVKEQEYGDYVWRELLLSAIAAQITRNGVLVDTEAAQARVDALAADREKIMAVLVEEHGFPTEGKSPWATTKGKEVIMAVLSEYGITPETVPDWEKTATGNVSLGGKTLIDLTKGTEAEEFGTAMATLKGQRSLAQLALDSTYEDGKAHPDITSLQRSGRWSMTRPGLTVWTKNEEKKYFVAPEGRVFAELDFSAADARAMAALSGDPAFGKRFDTDEEGNSLYDSHNLTGEVLFGADDYYEDGPRDKDARPVLRTPAKMAGHAQSYNIGSFKLAHTLNKACQDYGINKHFWAPRPRNYRGFLPEIVRQDNSIEVYKMVDKFNSEFAWLKNFKDRVVEDGDRDGFVVNEWGRRMTVDEGRSYNQSPALHGQSTTREMMADALIRLVKQGEYFARSIKAIIHDALWVELDEETAAEDVLVVKECMEAVFEPKRVASVPINFPVGVGPLGKTWYDCSHE